VRQKAAIDNDTVILNAETAAALKVRTGETVRVKT